MNAWDEQIDPVFQIHTPNGQRELNIYTKEGFRALANLWTRAGWQQRISYEVTWLGIPIIQLPEDILMLQELIWKISPDVIVECGVAHGGALIFYASLLELLGRGRVIGVDLKIRKYNRLAIESHRLSHRVSLIEGDSVDPATIEAVRSSIAPTDRVAVMLDSNHSRAHVLAELEAYSPLVSPDSYLVVFDSVMSIVSDAPDGEPEWLNNNPGEAILAFLQSHTEFCPDPSYERLSATYCGGGFLRRLRSD